MSFLASDFTDLWEGAPTVTVVHRAPGALDFEAQSVGAYTETAEDTAALFLAFELDKIDGQIVQSGDLRALLEPTSLATPPTGSDEVEALGSRWQIVGVQTIRPAAEALAYDVHLRGLR